MCHPARQDLKSAIASYMSMFHARSLVPVIVGWCKAAPPCRVWGVEKQRGLTLEVWLGLQSGATVHQEQLPDLAEGVAAFYHLATGQVLDDEGGLGGMLSGLGFEQVGGAPCCLTFEGPLL